MKSKIMVIVLIISLAINIGVVSMVLYRRVTVKRFWGRGPTVMGRMHTPRPLHRKLGLTKEQEEKIIKFKEETEKNIFPLRKSLYEKRKELFAMVKSGKIDEKKKQKLLQEVSSLQMQIESITLDDIVRIRNVMTPEQIEKMNKLFSKVEQGYGPRKFCK